MRLFSDFRQAECQASAYARTLSQYHSCKARWKCGHCTQICKGVVDMIEVEGYLGPIVGSDLLLLYERGLAHELSWQLGAMWFSLGILVYAWTLSIPRGGCTGVALNPIQPI